MQPLPILKKWIFYPVIILVALSVSTPALADYLGPNRTVTETTGVCKIVLNECQYVPAKNDYRFKNVDTWSCSNESKPWQAYPNEAPRDCMAATVGDQYWSREEDLQTVTITYPPTTISGLVQNCTLQNGWCGATIPQLSLSATEPIAGQHILLIEGVLNGQIFACPGGAATCNVPLSEGNNNFTYWALSSWGDSSAMGTTMVRVDTVSPDVGLSANGANGANGWYISPTTVTATGSDSTSGLAGAMLSVNNGAWQTSTTLDEGVHNISVTASDNAGNISNASATLSIDVTTPSIKMSTSGTVGKDGWYHSATQISATASDATSGIDSFEVSANGDAYQTYSSPISFSDGSHTIQLKAVDRAGNITETPVQKLYVDTIAPTIDLPASWQLGTSTPCRVQDTGSGLADLRLVIEDEEGHYPKVIWNEIIDGATFSQNINWNGQFGDGAMAPAGTYLVWIKASDKAGNERIQLGKVLVPETDISPSSLPPGEASTETHAPPEVFRAPPDDLNTPPVYLRAPQGDLHVGEVSSADTLIPAPEISTPQQPQDTAPLNTNFGGSTSSTKETTTQSLLLAIGTAGSIPTTSSNVLWGAAAAGAIGVATAYVLEERRKREESLAHQALEAAQELERKAKERANKLQKQQENWAKQQALEAASEQQRYSSPTISRDETSADMAWAILQATKKQREEEHKKTDEAKKNTEAQQQILAAYYAGAGLKEKEAPKPEPNWWEKTKSAVNENVIQPYIKPVSEAWRDTESRINSWVNNNIYYPHVQPAEEKLKKAATDKSSSLNKNLYQPYIQPVVKKTNEAVANGIAWTNEKIYQPYVKPEIEKIKQDVAKDIERLNNKVYQPYIQPVVKVVNEKLYQPYVKPVVEKISNEVTQAIHWTNENIYQPVFEPVVSDINQYIYQPLRGKVSNAWDQYGEWVHGALDAVGLIPGLGEIADGINGVIYLAEGRELEASLSLISAIPVFGYLGQAGKWTLKAGQEIVDTVAGKVAREFAENMVQRAAKESLEATSQILFKEAKEEILESLTKEAGEELLEKSAKESLEQGTEKAAKEISEDLTVNATRESFEETTQKTIEKVPEQVNRTEFINSLREQYGDEALHIVQKYEDRGVSLFEQYGNETIGFVERAEKLGVDPTKILDNPPSPGQTLEGWLLDIKNPENPVNHPLKDINKTKAELSRILEESIVRPESNVVVLGYGKDVAKPYYELSNEIGGCHLSLSKEAWTPFGNAPANFWTDINSPFLEKAIEQRKMLLFNTDRTTIIDPGNATRFSLPELRLIESPNNNYVRMELGKYELYVPQELQESYLEHLPSKLLGVINGS